MANREGCKQFHKLNKEAGNDNHVFGSKIRDVPQIFVFFKTMNDRVETIVNSFVFRISYIV